MKQAAVLGLGRFGKSVLDELLELKVDVIVVDKDREAIDAYKDASAAAVALDVLTVETLRKVLPESTDAVIIDMGDRIEASILAASYCKELNIKTIIAKAETKQHGEILELVGATKVVFPNREAAKRITPLLLSSALLNYLPVSGNLVIAELEVPAFLAGKTLVEADLRRKYGLNLISLREKEGEFGQLSPDSVFEEGTIGLFSGTDDNLERFIGYAPKEKRTHTPLAERFLSLFRGKGR
jgi:trk system potassium uptake protein TrkA